MTEKEILEQIKTSYQQILGEKLVGIYIHGSIAFGCFNYNTSDIDFIVVANQPPTHDEKIALIEVLLQIDKHCPPKGVEMSVVLDKFCKPFIYPTPYELHFSNSHKAKATSDIAGFCSIMNGTDKDLAAHFTVIYNVGLVLCGKDIKDVFGKVPEADYIDSIKYDIADAHTLIDENPVYIILNLCRVLAYMQDRVVISKAQGAIWGMDNLPAEYYNLITRAGEAYCGSEIPAIDKNTAHNFAEYALGRIFAE